MIHYYLRASKSAANRTTVLVAEECGFSPTYIDKADVKFPLNINDADISSTTIVTPKERPEFTELTWALIRV